jgi:PAS domain S-box-containing protein
MLRGGSMSEAENRFMDRPYLRFAFAVVAVAAAFLLRLALVRLIGEELPLFTIFFPAILASALYGGLWPALLATAVSALVADYWILTPHKSFAIAKPAQAVALAFFAATGVLLSLLAEADRRNQQRVAALKSQLVLRESEQKLRQTEERFETLANAIPQLCWMANPDGRIFWYNQRWYAYTGTTPEQMEGWGWQSVPDPDALPNVMERWKSSIATGEPFDMVFPLRGADGVFRPFLTRVMPVKDGDGKIVRWFGTNTDISEQKRVEAELRKNKDRLDLAVEVAGLGEWEIDLKEHTSLRSLRHDQIFGYQTLQPEWTFEMLRKHVLPECRAEFEAKFKNARAGGTWDCETQIRRADGEMRWIWARGRGCLDEMGQPSRMFGVVSDITERKQAQEAMRLLVAALDAAANSIVMTDRNGTIQWANAAFTKMTSYSAEEAIGKNPRLLKSGKHEAQFYENMWSAILSGSLWRGEVINRRKDGSLYVEEMTITPVRAADGSICNFLAVKEDITEIKQATEALQASEHRWATTLHSLGDAVISSDGVGHIDFMNEVAERLTGWPLAEARGKDLTEVFDIVQEMTRIKPDSPIVQVIRSGKVVNMANHTVLIHRDGTEIPIEDSAAPIRGSQGQMEGVVLVFHDCREQRRMEAALRSNERLATTGRLSASIAHEIHNPLDAVGNLLYLIGHDTQDVTTKEYAATASAELGRVTQMTQQMLAFQREAVKPVPVKVTDVVANVAALYDRKIKSAGIRLKQQIDFDGHIVMLPGELRQILANLLGNAIEALEPQGGTIALRAHASRDRRRGVPGLCLVVADDGPGIPVEVRNKIFEPFFTTKGESGTGLGLWITSDILRKYDGALRLRSCTRPERSGTCFAVFLPIHAGSELPSGT